MSGGAKGIKTRNINWFLRGVSSSGPPWRSRPTGRALGPPHGIAALGLALLSVVLSFLSILTIRPSSARGQAQCELAPDSSTVGLWHFNEGQGQLALDSSGNGRELTLGPSASSELQDPAWIETPFGHGLFFTSSEEDYANGLDSNTFPTNQLSVELWVQPVGGSGAGGYAQIFTAGFINCFLAIETFANVIQAGVGDGWTWEIATAETGGVDLDDGVWHYIAMTYDGNVLSIFIDGNEVQSLPGSLIQLAEPHDYKVGGRPFNTFLEGAMDEVRLSDIARSPEEILSHWNTAQSCLIPGPQGAQSLFNGKLVDVRATLPPLPGSQGKIVLANLADAPDPFQPPEEVSQLTFDLDVLELPGIQSKQFDFAIHTLWTIESLESGKPARVLSSEVPTSTTGLRPLTLTWNGKSSDARDLPEGLYVHQTRVELVRTKRSSGKSKVVDAVESPWRFVTMERRNPLAKLRKIRNDYSTYLQQVEQGIVDDPAVLGLINAGLRPSVRFTIDQDRLTHMTAPSLHVYAPTFLSSDSPRTIAMKFLSYYSASLGIDPAVVTLEDLPVREIGDTTVLIFRPKFLGLPILGNNIVVHVNADSSVAFYSGGPLPTTVASDAEDFPVRAIIDLHALSCTEAQNVSAVWLKQGEELSRGVTFDCGMDWIAADTGTGEILHRRLNLLTTEAIKVYNAYDLNLWYRENLLGAEEWSPACEALYFPEFRWRCLYLGDTDGEHHFQQVVQNDTIRRFYDSSKELLGYVGPADSAMIPNSVRLYEDGFWFNGLPYAGYYSTVNGDIHINRFLVDQMGYQTPSPIDDAPAYYHEADHQKVHWSLGGGFYFPYGHYAAGILEGHADGAFHAFGQYHSPLGYPIYQGGGEPVGWHLIPANWPNYPMLVTETPSWDLFWTVDSDPFRHNQGRPVLNWLLVLGIPEIGGKYEEVWLTQQAPFWSDAYKLMVPYGALHQMVVGGMLPLDNPRYIQWANTLEQAGLNWHYASLVDPFINVQVPQEFVVDSSLVAHALGFWSGPALLNDSPPSLDSPAGTEVVVNGERRTYFTYRSSEPWEWGQIYVQYMIPETGFVSAAMPGPEKSDVSPGIFTSGNGDAVLFWHSQDLDTWNRIGKAVLYSDTGSNPGAAGSLSTASFLDQSPELWTDREPAGVYCRGSNHFVFYRSDTQMIYIFREDNGAIYSYPWAPSSTGVAVAAADGEQCIMSGQRLFVAGTVEDGTIKVIELDRFYQFSDGFKSSEIGPHEPHLFRTDKTPSLAATQTGEVTFETLPVPHYVFNFFPSKLYLAWREPDAGTVVTSTFYLDWGCGIAHGTRGPLVPQAGIDTGAGPKLMSGRIDRGYPFQYTTVGLFTRQLQHPTETFYSYKIADRKD